MKSKFSFIIYIVITTTLSLTLTNCKKNIQDTTPPVTNTDSTLNNNVHIIEVLNLY